MQTKEKHIYKIIFYFIVLICFTSISNTVFSIPKSVLNKDKSKRETSLFNADFSILIDILLDEKGNLFVADRLNHQIKNIDLQKSIILLVAGNGNDGYSGDGGKALEASISHPSAIALDNNNNLFIADDFKHCVRKVDLQTGLITTIVGIGESGFSGDGKLAIKSGYSDYRVDIAVWLIN